MVLLLQFLKVAKYQQDRVITIAAAATCGLFQPLSTSLRPSPRPLDYVKGEMGKLSIIS